MCRWMTLLSFPVMQLYNGLPTGELLSTTTHRILEF